ncbi:MAG: ABC transporter permease [Acidimicrobiia bacterium]|nr:MAG: ABC transporter permease [Acidimicrobiia bacterium]
MTTTYYDSDHARKPLASEVSNLWNHRGLIRLIVTRDLTVRYKRSTLGVWWTLLNPLLTTGVMWVVFGNFFRFDIKSDVPYIVYLLSGILLITYFAQAVLASGSAIVNSAGILTKVYVPPEVFSVSAAIAAAVNFVISLAILLIIQLITGVGVPWTVVFIPVVVLAMLALTAGLGLLIAAAAVHFFDVLDLTGVAIQLIGYLTPTFYPLAFVPEKFQWMIKINPLYSYLTVFRDVVYGNAGAELWMWAYMIVSAVVILVVGVYLFSRSWRRLVILL